MLGEDLRRRYLSVMGIQVWVPRTADALVSGNEDRSERALGEPREPPTGSGDQAVCELDWSALEARVRQCTACRLHRTRTQTVFGTGLRTADWMIIGEAPGANEDQQGEPFVGVAGQLLNEMLRAVGLDRERVFIANILKCRPPRNRDPMPDEVSACRAFLQRQVALVDPRIILAVGRVAAQNLLETTEAIGRLRGTVHAYGAKGIPLVVVYHPAYLLRSLLEKRKAWDDLQLAMRVFAERA